MKIIIVSNPKAIIHEIETVKSLFKSGLEVFHLRKPGYSKAQYEAYLDRIPSKYWNRIVIHDHFILALKYNLRGVHISGRLRNKSISQSLKINLLKFLKPDLKISATHYTLASFKKYDRKYEYVFLSPVFDAISEDHRRSPFRTEDIRLINANPEYRVIAMGGVQEQRIPMAKELGFNGVALLGSIWKSKDPVGLFSNIKLNIETAGAA